MFNTSYIVKEYKEKGCALVENALTNDYAEYIKILKANPVDFKNI